MTFAVEEFLALKALDRFGKNVVEGFVVKVERFLMLRNGCEVGNEELMHIESGEKGPNLYCIVDPRRLIVVIRKQGGLKLQSNPRIGLLVDTSITTITSPRPVGYTSTDL